MEFLLSLVLLLVLAKVFGEVAEQLGFPSMLGYLLAGMGIGWSGLMVPDTNVVIFGELGAILLLFVAGMRELDTTHILQNRKATYASAILGFLFPALAIIIVVANAHLIDPRLSFGFVGAATLVASLSVSSVVTSMKVLIRTRKLNTDVGRVVLSTGVIDALFGLAVFTMLLVILPLGLSGMFDGLLRIVSVTVMLIVIFILGENIIPSVVEYTADLEVEEAQFTLAFVVMLVLAVVVGAFGLHGVIGAFLAGIIISRSPLREGGFSDKLSSLAYGVFVPIFFAWVGMIAFTEYSIPFWSWFIILLAVAVFVSNFLGSYIGTRIGGYSKKSAALVGIGMIPRGGVGLVILAAIATSSPPFLEGAMKGFVYSTVIWVVVLSILIPPILMTLALKEKAI